jgi:hypothetical protein
LHERRADPIPLHLKASSASALSASEFSSLKEVVTGFDRGAIVEADALRATGDNLALSNVGLTGWIAITQSGTTIGASTGMPIGSVKNGLMTAFIPGDPM